VFGAIKADVLMGAFDDALRAINNGETPATGKVRRPRKSKAA
jgi:hypothetical protein